MIDTSVKGIDISLYQPDYTDFSNMKPNGFEFAIIRISEGQSKDRYFEQHYENLGKAGIARGVYIYSHATSEAKAIAEANFALEILNGRKLELPIFVDLESSDINYSWNHNIMPWVTAFGNTIKSAGYRWGTYSNESWYKNKMDLDQLKELGAIIWLAAYNGTPITIDHDIWQYNNVGRIEGYDKNLDLNLMHDESLIEWSEENVKPEQTPEEDSKDEEVPTTKGVRIKSEEHAIQMAVNNALREVGQTEKATNDQLYDKTANTGYGNWNKYADYIYRNYPEFYNGNKNGYPYCDVFHDCVHICTFGVENAYKILYQPKKSTGAGCSNSAAFYRNNGRFFTTPKVGDQVFFGEYGNEGHTGIVVAVNGSVITTVEGNTSPNPGLYPDGYGIFKKTYDTATYYIPGYGRPNYAMLVGKVVPNLPVAAAPDASEIEPNSPDDPYEEPETDTSTDTVYSRPMLKYGSTGSYVKEAQELLISKGYSVGADGADGVFGSNTYYAVKEFQKANFLEVDGIIGNMTWAKLLEYNEDVDTEPDDSENTVTESWNTPKVNITISLPLLRFKDRHNSVLAMLSVLKEKGYYTGTVKDTYDEKVKESVMEFQRDNKLSVDSEVGSDTWSSILK